MDLKKLLAELKSKNYYEVLGVDLEDSNFAIRKARTKLLAKYHPDLYKGEEKELAVSISSTINIAFEALSDSDFKKKYNESGFELIYSVGGNHSVVKNKAKNLSEEKKQAPTITGTALVDKGTLINGGKIKVQLTKYPNVELPDTVELMLPKNTKANSTLVFKGDGDTIKGNIIVLVTIDGTASDDLSDRLLNPHEKFVYTSVKDNEGNISTISEDFSISLKNEYNLKKDTLLIVNNIGIRGATLLIEG